MIRIYFGTGWHFYEVSFSWTYINIRPPVRMQSIAVIMLLMPQLKLSRLVLGHWFLMCLGDDLNLKISSKLTFISDRKKVSIVILETYCLINWLVNFYKRSFWHYTKISIPQKLTRSITVSNSIYIEISTNMIHIAF